jgi:uncharacterized protein
MRSFAEHGVIDTFVHFPSHDPTAYDWLNPALGPQRAVQPGSLPVDYLFRGAPKLPSGEDPLDFVLSAMDRHGVSMALVDVTDPHGVGRAAITSHPGRFRGTFSVDPNAGMQAVRALSDAHNSMGIVAATAGPAFFNPQVPIDDKKFYPLYAKCVELGIPICLTTGVPGPRVPMSAQDVARLDEVCWFFPELKIVMRHGAEPWEELAVKLMLKWPNLYYSTSAFSPRRYPKRIIEFANSRGSDKIIYAGYFAVGLTYEKIFSELGDLQLRDDVLPKFLSANARHVFNI